ncbi:MAG TPA: hypothetical protein VJJ47_02600 [Candidatus Paceibacterota bacterium]
METLNAPPQGEQVRRSSTAHRLAWFFGVIAAFGAGQALADGRFLGAVAMALAAVLLIPPLYARVAARYKRLSLDRNLRGVIAALLFGAASVGIVAADDAERPTRVTTTAAQEESAPAEDAPSSKTPSIGEAGVLEMSGGDGGVCLAPTKDAHKELVKVFLANDYLGLLEIPGVFCVAKGTEVTVIDSAFGLRRVRVTAAFKDVDQDKVGRPGWVAMEFVHGR